MRHAAFRTAVWTLSLVVGLVGCVPLTGVNTAPKSFEAKVVAAYATVTTVRKTGQALALAGKLRKRDAQDVQDKADLFRQGIEIAEEMHADGDVAADSKLYETSAALNALERYLTERQKAKVRSTQ